ncbi:Membrane protein involved in the export of O-antigen and teichoic acid [Maribacter sedimenticola]|uniref:Membrane protein involved in the export of O-antigen and teichoic acid n=1 Tax=Maribacter sedimenticola TaxID=228956 RepID=A0ABY1SKD2_9FLAO|nr:oligosaccharide flippase family protein [Maribacter sedimenticola]SNR69748.1 Membrane protein involved in the export of O-antigen and teichoic acid [Maribacter sedimenticola]
MTTVKVALNKVTSKHLFMGSAILVNGGNYLYNLLLGRILGPEAFADAALLVTLLLVLSFVGMTFQLTTTKFAVLFSGNTWTVFKSTMYRYALMFGVCTGAVIYLFSEQLQVLFQTENHGMFKIFALSVPLYFFMSVNRGRFQGKHHFGKLAATYQTEMWSRLILTFLLLLLLPLESSLLIAMGIALSFIFGLFPSDIKNIQVFAKERLSSAHLKEVWIFIGLTAGYELTQIIINNSDILLVKHYFNDTDAGLYSSLALIGRVVYFVAWMFVMLLMPTVIQKQKDGEPTAPILFKYVFFISALSSTIVLACYWFPELIISLMFGDAYISIAHLLWQYALATSLFAISNIFAYYFLSLNQYAPVILSGILGLSQVVLVTLYHDTLETVVQVQIIAMVILLIAQVIFFLIKNSSSSNNNDLRDVRPRTL